MDATVIGAIFTGITGLVTAIGGYLLNHAKARSEDEREDRYDELRRRFTLAMTHIYQLRALMQAAHMTVPELPHELDTHQSHPPSSR